MVDYFCIRNIMSRFLQQACIWLCQFLPMDCNYHPLEKPNVEV
uniref:Uncharacterized protein n=1 Tax=Anguilla anguilla TaxID=7936 RepID=A0A0E9W3T6_ANGAN